MRQRILLSSSSFHKTTTNFYQKKKETSDLEWETFDYGKMPKMDTRFLEDGKKIYNHNKDNNPEKTMKEDAEEDERTADRLDQYWNALTNLSPQLVEDATNALEPYVNPDRIERIDSVLNQRTQNTRFLFENPSNPSNVWACLRSIDSFGIQFVDVVIDNEEYEGKQVITQKRGMRTAMGSAQWLTIRNHLSTKAAIKKLKSEGYKLYASDLNPTSKDIRTMNWNEDNNKEDDNTKICIIMGNEQNGISDEMREMADETFTLPMSGFAESFNLSVATAITLAHLSSASSDKKGPLRPGDLDVHTKNCLRLKGIWNSLAQKRMGNAVLKRKNVQLPEEITKFNNN